MVERIRCATPECELTMLPETAAKTGGICMRCVREREDAERSAFIKANRRDVNFFEGITDPIEILHIMHRRQSYDPLVREISYPKSAAQVCGELSDHDAKRLVNRLVQMIGTEEQETACDIAMDLRLATDHCLDAFLESLIDAGEIYPGILFVNGSAAIRDALLNRIEAKPNHTLCALAWIGDDVVVGRFDQWRRTPPDWAAQLFVAPHEYAHEAGWELTADGNRRDLILQTCFPLVAAKDTAVINAAVDVLVPASERCRWCKRELIYLFDVDVQQLGWGEVTRPHWRVLTCEVCSCFGNGIFSAAGNDGLPVWSKSNVRPAYLPTDKDEWTRLPSRSLVLSGRPRRSLLKAYSIYQRGYSQIGGYPSWEQDAEYPTCPHCCRTMMFLGQIDTADIDANFEGTHYGFICDACGTTATNYQTT